MNANYKSLILAISLFFALPAPISAAPGDLDPTFGSGGIVITRGSNINELNSVAAMAIQSDGKIIVVGDGTFGTFNWDFAVVRYNADGSLDSSFGDRGIVITQLTGNYDGATSVAIQSDGKIVVAGNRYSCFSECADASFAVVRYNPNGSLDTSFNGTGIVITSFGNSLRDSANSVAIQSDGRIVVAGSSGSGSNRHFAIVRYNADGSLDTTFNGTGKVITQVGGGSFSAGANSVAIQSDGKIIAAGESQQGFAAVTVVRYNTDGTLDSSFNGTGKVVTSVGDSDSGASDLAIQADSKIVVAGYRLGIPGNFFTADFALVRYNPDGSPDSSFGGTGKITIPVGNSYDFASSVAIQVNGKIVVAGYSRNNNNIGSDFAVARFNSNGSLDTSFNSTGIVTTGFGGQDYAISVAIQADGKIVVAGGTDNQLYDFYDFVVVRYQGEGATPTPTPTPTPSPTATPTATPTPTTTPTPIPTPSPIPRANGKIAFTSDRDGNPEIYVMNADGTNQVRLTNNSVVDDQSSWSPDGKKIAFVSQTASGGSAIFMMKADGTNKVEITPNAGGPISWSPDGNRIAFGFNNDIAIVDIDGSNRRNLTDGLEPSWSPDGSKILFTRLVSGSPLLHTIRPDGTNLQALPNGSGADFSPKWSSSGDKIAFLVNVGDFFMSIFTANADGTNRQFFDGCGLTILDNCGTDRLGPSWSPDATKIIFDVSDYFRVDSEIYVKNIDGTGRAQLTNTPGRNSTPSWQPLALAVPNPIDDAQFFVRQHYLDFLNREPESSGFEAWLHVLADCPPGDASCSHHARLITSAAFFGSPEFQLKGYFVFRFYRLAFDRLPTFEEITPDLQGVAGQTPAEVYARKAAFTNSFVQRQEFISAFSALSNANFVASLFGRYQLTRINTPDPASPDGTLKLTFSDNDLSNALNSGAQTRAQVLRAIADSDEVFQLEFNRAFVAMQYYGYLRRTPEPDGYQDWLNYLDAHPTDFLEMVRGFVDSTEYRRRFGQP